MHASRLLVIALIPSSKLFLDAVASPADASGDDDANDDDAAEDNDPKLLKMRQIFAMACPKCSCPLARLTVLQLDPEACGCVDAEYVAQFVLQNFVSGALSIRPPPLMPCS